MSKQKPKNFHRPKSEEPDEPEEQEENIPEVGADPEEEMEELRRQGYTDEGLTNPLDHETPPS